jgi:hypothetical protein
VTVDGLIVADPQCSVPGFVSCPTVHGVVCVCSFKVYRVSGGNQTNSASASGVTASTFSSA